MTTWGSLGQIGHTQAGSGYGLPPALVVANPIAAGNVVVVAWTSATGEWAPPYNFSDTQGNQYAMINGVLPASPAGSIIAAASVLTTGLTNTDTISVSLGSGSVIGFPGDCIAYAVGFSFSGNTATPFVNNSNAVGAPGGSHSLSASCACAVGDLLLGFGATFSSGTGGDGLLGGSGWTDISGAAVSNGQSTIDLAYKVATGTSDSYTFTSVNGVSIVSMIGDLTGTPNPLPPGAPRPRQAVKAATFF